jgi:alpha/beta superfamily hydrolase
MSTPVSLPGPQGNLEGVVDGPVAAATDAVAVICHPHPLYHGTMNNKVVHTLARAVAGLGRPAVRFNFRGVGASAGEYGEAQGEIQDLLAVVAWARDRWPAAELWLAGFSFGGYVALSAAAMAAPGCLITVAPSIQRFDMSAFERPRCPWLVIHGGDDEVVDSQAVADWAAGLEPPPDFRLMPETDHFFHGRLVALRETAQDFLSAHAPACREAIRC